MRSASILLGKSVALLGLVFSVMACSLVDDDEKDVIAPLPELAVPIVSLDKSWSRSVGSQGDDALGLSLTPVIDGGSIYGASADGRVVAISRSGGEMRWKAALDTPLISAVGAGADLVFVCSQDGGVFALDAATGETRWRAQASSEVVAAAVTDGDIVVVQAVDSRVQAFDVRTGNTRWSYGATQAILTLRGNAAPVIRDGVVYVAFDNGKMAAIDAYSGLMRWEQRFAVPEGRSELERVIDVQADPVVTEVDVVVGSFQGAVTSLSRERGQPQWQEKASVAKSMTVADGSIFIVEGNDDVRALRLSSGREAWKFGGFTGRKLSAPAAIGSYVAIADREGYVHLLSQADGTYAGRYQVGGGGVRVNLVSDGEVLYVLTASGKLHALALGN